MDVTLTYIIMENKTYKKWLEELQANLATIENEEMEPLDRVRHTLPMISGLIAKIKAYVIEDGFASVGEEIQFFKHIKPALYAAQLFEVFWYNLSVQKPAGTKEMIKAFYEEELLQIFRLFRTQAFHYQYYKTSATELDHLYFVRGAQPVDIPVLEIIDPYPGFSTTLDYAFAKFMAYERLQVYLLEQLSVLFAENCLAKTADRERHRLRWTGETINLVELAYGIWLTGQINNGNASITEIVEALEVFFNVKIGLAFRRWFSISKRKRISQTKYIDQMQAAVLKRLDDELR
jgi:hypothetical protein